MNRSDLKPEIRHCPRNLSNQLNLEDGSCGSDLYDDPTIQTRVSSRQQSKTPPQPFPSIRKSYDDILLKPLPKSQNIPFIENNANTKKPRLRYRRRRPKKNGEGDDDEFVPSSLEERPLTSQEKKCEKDKDIYDGIKKNYVAVIMNAFASIMVNKDSNQNREMILTSMFRERVLDDYNEMRLDILDFIRNDMLGKKNHQSARGNTKSRQYKITSKKHLVEILHENSNDSEKRKKIKCIIRSMVVKFLDSTEYQTWIDSTYYTRRDYNKNFLANRENIEHFKKVFTMLRYRPSFKKNQTLNT